MWTGLNQFWEMIDNKFKVIFWDFDGVLMNSNTIRDLGFIRVLSDYPDAKVNQLMLYHQKNGGLSRYVKFRYFFEDILDQSVTDEEILHWAEKFSVIMRELLIDHTLLIDETINFVKNNHEKKMMHIVSGSDQAELRHICSELDIAKFFDSINGSPTPKKEWVREILSANSYDKKECVLIGDSVNDKEAAEVNDISFIPYNYS